MKLQHSKAFSLIELLASIAVLTVLMVLGASVMSYAPKQANEVRCASNLRQLYQGFMAYARDHDGRLPFGAREPDIPEINASFYGGQYGKEFKAYIPGKNGSGSNTGYIEPYLCPSDREVRSGTHYGYFGHSYGVNMTICRDNYARTTTWRNPARVFLLADSKRDIIARSSPDTNLAPRHRGGANTLFLDGHVEWRSAPFPNWTENRAFWVPDYE